MTSPTDPTNPAIAPAATKRSDLEIKDAQIIFSAVWQDLEADYGRENLLFPKEFILLGGAVLCFTIVVFFGGDSFL